MPTEETVAPPKRTWRGALFANMGGVGVGLGILMMLAEFGALAVDAPESLPLADIVDPGSIVVAEARFDIALVQLGTDQPFTGNGAPSINLEVEADGSVLDWTLVAWANETAQPPEPRFCQSHSIHYAPQDWLFEADSNANHGGQGTYTAVPADVRRMGPSGDQCLLRVRATGVWGVKVCVEGPPVGDGDVVGPPRKPYKDDDGAWHIDLWDRCIERLFQVPS